MKLKSNDVIKHENFMDVAIFLTADPIPLKDGGLAIKGLWMNQAFVNSFIIDPFREFGKMRHKIKKEDVSKWLKCENPSAKCIRYEKWERVA